MKSPCHDWLASASVAAVASVVLEIVTQLLPPHYSALAEPESNLAVGPYGFLQATAFFLRGAATLLVVHAAKHILAPPPGRARLGAHLLEAAGFAKLALALAPTDIAPRPETLHGFVHLVAALVAFGAGATGQLVIAYGLRQRCEDGPITRLLVRLGWALIVLGCIVLGTLPVASRVGFWGALERMQTALSITWFLLSVIPLWRHAERANHDYARRTNIASVSTR